VKLAFNVDVLKIPGYAFVHFYQAGDLVKTGRGIDIYVNTNFQFTVFFKK